MAAPKLSGHMNITPDVTAPVRSAQIAPAGSASQLDTSSMMLSSSNPLQRKSALPLLDSVAYDPCPRNWNRALVRAVPVSLALLGALAFGSADSPAPAGLGVAHTEGSSGMNVSLTELARVARMQLVAADATYAPQALTGAASELTPSSGSDRGSRSERMQKRREAAEARRAAAKERREAAKQARLEARAARIEARKARSSGRDDSDDDDDSSSASDRREARREAYAERRAAAKEKREAAAAARREAAQERRAAYLERKAAAKEKRESASDSRHATLQERREAAKERRAAALAARREAAEERRAAAEERREAARAAKEERLAAKESRASSRDSSVASSGMGKGGTFGHAEATMAPANGAALLRINSRPWAQVYVDGRLVGNTPQLALQLPPGEHNVRLVNGIFAMGKVLNVKLRAGERVTRVEMLEE